MKSTLLKSILACTLLAGVVNSATAQTTPTPAAGTASTHPFTVCKSATGFKLTTQAYPSGYTFTWTPGTSPAGSAASTATNGIYEINSTTLAGMTPGTVYSYKVQVNSGAADACSSEEKEFFVTVVDPTVTLAVSTTSGGTTSAAVCQEDITPGAEGAGTIYLTATPGAGTVASYIWSPAADVVATSGADNTTTATADLTAGTTTQTFGVKAVFTVDVPGTGGTCTSTEATIAVNPQPVAPTATITGL